MLTLHLGEVVVPYAEEGKTTGDVAEILEGKYNVMQIFVDQNIRMIADCIQDNLAGAIENMYAGKELGDDIFAGAGSKIEARFREFIDLEEHGIVTKSKLSPISGTRKKRQYRKVSGKTVFWDTGAYSRNFKAWVEK